MIDKRIAIYARVSTVDKGQDIQTQTLLLRDFAQLRGWAIYKIYEDTESGSKESRPALNQMIREAHQRKFDCVLVFRFDRFARSSKQLINSLELFRSLGIDFISYQENVDTTTPAGKMMFTIISAFAEFERAIIQERVRAGLENARRKGRRLGRPKIVVDQVQIEKLRTLGWSLRKIGKALNIPKSTVAKHCP